MFSDFFCYVFMPVLGIVAFIALVQQCRLLWKEVMQDVRNNG